MGWKTPEYIRKIERVYRRDGGVCHLCGYGVNQHLRVPDPYAGTVDHIIPRSHNGTNHIDNLKLAHLVCNMVRASHSVEEARERLRSGPVRYCGRDIHVHCL